MQTENKNKMMDKLSSKDLEQEFHFGGDLKFLPAIVKAKNYQEALAKWEKIRVTVSDNNN